MPHQTAVILVVGLTKPLSERMQRIGDFAARGATRRVKPVLPAVTCAAQATMLTGSAPREHGVVGNGWWNRELCEPNFWKQPSALVGAEKVWETARRRDASVTCANLFWWFNMFTSADVAVTPRPIYKADGRKAPDCWSKPAALRDELQAELGRFPLFHFWGPGSSVKSSEWIARAAKRVFESHNPTLSLVYLPHLDYAHQKFGPDAPQSEAALAEIDGVAGDLIDFYEERGVRTVIVSEYGVEPVERPVHVNRALREAGLLAIREEDGGEHIDFANSGVFALADHQIAHVTAADARTLDEAKEVCAALAGIERVLDREAQCEFGLDHPRAGDLVLVADEGAWFTYYHWLDDARAPDFARTVDIHRKPGYDPAELFIDPEIRFPRLAIAARLAKRKLGLRTLMDVIPLDASLVKGSHGRADVPPERMPIAITRRDFSDRPEEIACADVRGVILEQLFAE